MDFVYSRVGSTDSGAASVGPPSGERQEVGGRTRNRLSNQRTFQPSRRVNCQNYNVSARQYLRRSSFLVVESSIYELTPDFLPHSETSGH
jgi:hypothetical protein